MTNDRRVLVHADKAALAASVSARFITKMVDILDERPVAHVVLTGGSMGIAVLESINASPARDTIDWDRVHAWWGDERWVAAGHPDRNDKQATDALLAHVGIRADHVHPFPASDAGISLDEAAEHYAAELSRHAEDGADHPVFEVTFLGVGPDGHIASLFPHRSGIGVGDRTVIPVRNSPKPPPERLSLTRPVLNASERIWLVLAGADKASALGLALAGASRDEVPVAGIKGRRRTVFFVDGEAAAEVPEQLISRDA
jgi:6-phosphogluconolactonase